MRTRRRPWFWTALLSGAISPFLHAQIDPYPRELIQIGYHKELKGIAPLSGYAYYYRNMPNFYRSNLTLRVAVSPVHVDGELGIRRALGPQTDLGIGFAGGGFAYRYDEIRLGRWLREESWLGHGGEVSGSAYHLFNPGARVPLHGILRGGFQYATYVRDDDTSPAFVIPHDQPELTVRAGVRWGGQELELLPDLGFELSGWYEGRVRLDSGPYGFGGDRWVEPSVHLFWGRAAVRYTLPESRHTLGLSLNAGTTMHPDRLSAYRLGGMLNLSSEFPYMLPGYYFNELSTRNFVLLGGSYELPIDARNRWRLGAGASTGYVSFTPGMDQPRHWHSGVAASLSYRNRSDAVRAALVYGYGINAMRSHGEGGHAVALLLQVDLQKPRGAGTGDPGRDHSSFFKRLLRAF